jgi:hypothetical protein
MPATVRTVRRTEITLEREHRIEIAPARGAPLTCAHCTGSPMLEPAAIAVLVGVGTRDLYRAIERGALHFEDAREARLTVCLRSAEILTTTDIKENRR